jgi:hypothetical protein
MLLPNLEDSVFGCAPLFFSALYKSFLFTLFVLGTVIIFSIFIPLFAFRELGRVMGEDKFRDLFFRMGATARTDAPVVT